MVKSAAKSAVKSSKGPRNAATRKSTPEGRKAPAPVKSDGTVRSKGRQPNAVQLENASQSLECGLYVVSTPIGNLEDITLRAIKTLQGTDRIACEDTRVTGKLLKHFGIETPMVSYNDHNGARVRPRLLKELASGKSVALVSDAGTPLISDPGLKLVQSCSDNNIRVFPIPGASALLAGLVVAGLPTDRVMFVGFLPPKQNGRRSALGTLKTIPATLVFYETGPRIRKSLADMADRLGARPAAVGRELTKHFEEVKRGPLDQLARSYGDPPAPKGELVVVVGPPDTNSSDDHIDIDDALREALQTSSVRDAAAMVAELTGQPRRKLYARAVDLSQETSNGSKR